MFLVDPPAVSAPAPQANQPDVIEVVGTRRDQTLKIDRRTYQVQQTPHSAQKDAVQLLRGLPAVTITPDDTIMILGSDNAQIYVDGRPYRGDSTQYLRSLHGSDIERIEVITNPSAQYSAEGTAGIINFVLRKKQSDGISGTATSEISSIGHATTGATLKSKHGKWTYEIEANAEFGRNSRSRYHKLRTVEVSPDGASTINTEDGHGHSRDAGGDASAKVSYELDARTSLSAKIAEYAQNGIQTGETRYIGRTPDFQSFTEHQRQTDPNSATAAELSFDHKGNKEGETLTGGLDLTSIPGEHGHTVDTTDTGGGFDLRQDNRWLFGDGKIDWQHPMAEGEVLSLGASWDYSSEDQRYAFTSFGDDGSLGPDTIDRFKAISNTFATYTTFQKKVGTWTFMPGVRVEQNMRNVSSAGRPDVSLHGTKVFPTLHIDHPLSKTLDLTLSYSKRIDRAQATLLRPFLSVQSALSTVQGNPRLRDQSTNSYEINLHYRHAKIDAGLIIYDRETSHLWSTTYTVTDGVTLFTWVNAGRKRDSGAEFDFSLPLIPHLKANGSFNLFDERAPVATAAGSRSENRVRYTTNSTVEWDGPERNNRPGDMAQLQWIYESPVRTFETDRFSVSQFSLSYTHNLSRTLSVTGMADYWTASGHRLIAPLAQEYLTTPDWLEFKVRLLKTFGKR